MFQYEAKARLETMSSSTSISSADLFGDGSSRSSGKDNCVMEYCVKLDGQDGPPVLTLVDVCVYSVGGSGFESVLPSGPDMAQFKQGVKTVAGKMAVLANGVMNTIQVRGRMISVTEL